ncbi:cytokinin dehydrogenase 3 [Citrus sinensis]|nr:cytokinin dehydrogenase 3 [Citrus sinensis]
MTTSSPIAIYFIALFVASSITSTMLAISVPPELTDNLHTDPGAIKLASIDYGRIINEKPFAVLYPSSLDDIRTLINLSYCSSLPYTIAAKGQAHSTWGQAQANKGVVVQMSSLNSFRNGTGILISGDRSSGFYADVGGEQLWIDVLNATLAWGDSGQTYRKGPQITNVLELDVLTGKGEFVTCTSQKDTELFYAVLGGLGQFGLITRARIVLGPAKERVKWLRILYSDFSSFSTDQETLISTTGPSHKVKPDYLEGQLLMSQSPLDFYPQSQHQKITSLINQYGIVYLIEVATYYDNKNEDKRVKQMLKSLKGFVHGFVFEKDVTYLEFLNRVHDEERVLRKKGLWDIPHPWLNIFIPRSRITDLDNGAFRNILLKRNFTSSTVLVYPLLRSNADDWETFDNRNKDILQFCVHGSIKFKQYLGHHATKEEWINHFGSKWNTFQQRKARFDPKMILSPGQRILNN